MPPSPVTPVTEWACTLAAVSWGLESTGNPMSQDQIMIHLAANFPTWQTYKGYLAQWEIPILLERLGLNFTRLLCVSDKDELLADFSKHHTQFLMGFLFTKKPTNHTMAIASVSAQGLTVSNGAIPQSSFEILTWDECLTAREGQVMFVYQ